MLLLAVAPVDFAILGTLGLLWIAGGSFIYLVHRWVRRYEGLSDARS